VFIYAIRNTVSMMLLVGYENLMCLLGVIYNYFSLLNKVHYVKI